LLLWWWYWLVVHSVFHGSTWGESTVVHKIHVLEFIIHIIIIIMHTVRQPRGPGRPSVSRAGFKYRASFSQATCEYSTTCTVQYLYSRWWICFFRFSFFDVQYYDTSYIDGNILLIVFVRMGQFYCLLLFLLRKSVTTTVQFNSIQCNRIRSITILVVQTLVSCRPQQEQSTANHFYHVITLSIHSP
jgi:hypothetical protein